MIFGTGTSPTAHQKSARRPADVCPAVLHHLTERTLAPNHGIGSKRPAFRGILRAQDDIRYVCRRYLTAEVARSIAVEITNATFAARAQAVWGAGSTAVASDSTHFDAFDQNIFHRVALPLRRPRCAHLLARGAQKHGYPLATDQLLGIRDGQGGDAARHPHGG